MGCDACKITRKPAAYSSSEARAKEESGCHRGSEASFSEKLLYQNYVMQTACVFFYLVVYLSDDRLTPPGQMKNDTDGKIGGHTPLDHI